MARSDFRAALGLPPIPARRKFALALARHSVNIATHKQLNGTFTNTF